MRRIVVASKNPVKVAATRLGFARAFAGEAFDVSGVDVPSGVSDQPMSDDETLRGAANRAAGARAAAPDADFWVGLEGGVHDHAGQLEGFAWIVVIGTDRRGQSRTATFQIPPRVAELVRAGVELGHADDQVFGRSNSKQANGAVGLLTRDVIDRTSYYEYAVILALIPFVSHEYYAA